MEQTNENKQETVKADTKDLAKTERSIASTLLNTPDADKIMKELGLRKCNTIPEKVKLKITFEESAYHLGSYEFFDGKGNSGTRPTTLIVATVSYEPKASHLVMGLPFLLSLPASAIIGLSNYNRAKKKDFDLKGRTFTVINRNGHTYEWTEIGDKR
jgi:hypothetical protein